MASYLLQMIGSAAIASLVVTGVMAYERSLQLAGRSKRRRNGLRNRRDQGPPDA